MLCMCCGTENDHTLSTHPCEICGMCSNETGDWWSPRVETPPAPRIVRTEDHGTVSFRGSHFALDLTLRPAEVKRAGWHAVLDDDPKGEGLHTRLHVYGVEGLKELSALLCEGLAEIAAQERGVS